MYKKPGGFYIFFSDRMDKFEFSEAIPFFDGGVCEIVRNDGDRSLMAGGVGGCLKFGEVNWSDPVPQLKQVTREQLIRWQSVPPLVE